MSIRSGNKSILTHFNLPLRANHVAVIATYEKSNTTNRHVLSANRSISRAKLSPTSRKKLSNAVGWMVNSARWKEVYRKSNNKRFWFKVNFITLNMPCQMWGKTYDDELQEYIYYPLGAYNNTHISDKDAKEILLHKFLLVMYHRYKMRNYVWKAETQENGNIHFHITTDTFVDKKAIQHEWNTVLAQNSKLIDIFKEKHHHSNPPSTEITAVRSAENMGNYIASELAKNLEGRRAIDGRLWGCNYNLSKVWHLKLEVDPFDEKKILRGLDNNLYITRKEITKKDALGNERFICNIFFWKTPIGLPAALKKAYDEIKQALTYDLDIIHNCGDYLVSLNPLAQAQTHPANALAAA